MRGGVELEVEAIVGFAVSGQVAAQWSFGLLIGVGRRRLGCDAIARVLEGREGSEVLSLRPLDL